MFNILLIDWLSSIVRSHCGFLRSLQIYRAFQDKCDFAIESTFYKTFWFILREYEIDQSNERTRTIWSSQQQLEQKEKETHSNINSKKSSCCGVIFYYIYRSCQSIEREHWALNTKTHARSVEQQALGIYVHMIYCVYRLLSVHSLQRTYNQ